MELQFFVVFVSYVSKTLHEKWGFPLRIFSVNVTKSAGNSGFGHIYWRNLKEFDNWRNQTSSEFLILNFQFIITKVCEFFVIDKFCEKRKPKRKYFPNLLYLLFNPILRYCIPLPRLYITKQLSTSAFVEQIFEVSIHSLLYQKFRCFLGSPLLPLLTSKIINDFTIRKCWRFKQEYSNNCKWYDKIFLRGYFLKSYWDKDCESFWIDFLLFLPNLKLP